MYDWIYTIMQCSWEFDFNDSRWRTVGIFDLCQIIHCKSWLSVVAFVHLIDKCGKVKWCGSRWMNWWWSVWGDVKAQSLLLFYQPNPWWRLLMTITPQLNSFFLFSCAFFYFCIFFEKREYRYEGNCFPSVQHCRKVRVYPSICLSSTVVFRFYSVISIFCWLIPAHRLLTWLSISLAFVDTFAYLFETRIKQKHSIEAWPFFILSSRHLSTWMHRESCVHSSIFIDIDRKCVRPE